MVDDVAVHYGGRGGLADVIAERIRSAGKDLDQLKTTDLATIDEFHIRGRKATLELAEWNATMRDQRRVSLQW